MSGDQPDSLMAGMESGSMAGRSSVLSPLPASLAHSAGGGWTLCDLETAQILACTHSFCLSSIRPDSR